MQRTTCIFWLAVFIASAAPSNDAKGQSMASISGRQHRTATTIDSQALIGVLTKLETQFGVNFNYDNDLLENIKVAFDETKMRTVPLHQLLGELLDPAGLRFERTNGQHIIIMKKQVTKGKSAGDNKALARDGRPIGPMQQTINGTITDENGLPLEGVSILHAESGVTTKTATNGSFVLSLAERSGLLTVSFIGYVSQQVAIPASGNLIIRMEPEVTALTEVVVTGYSKEQKKDIIGSVSIVDTENLLSIPSGNVKTQLQGNAAGVTVSSSGSPGSGGKVRIRGFGSFGGSDPLYIIDGVPASQSGVDNLNANDIESMQVLKDAASAAIYGARAANGVIIITTKNGKPGKTKLSFNSYYGVNFISKSDFPDVLNAQENGELYWKSMIGAGRQVGDPDWGHPQYGNGPEPVIPEYIMVVNNGARIGGAELEALKHGNASQQALFAALVNPDSYDFATHQIVRSANTNWAEEVFKPAAIQTYQVGLSGGGEAGNYAIGLNYFNEGNTASEYNKFDRYTLRANTQFNLGKRVRVGENVQLAYRTNDASSIWASTVMTMHPLVPVWDEFGNPAGNAAPSTGGEPEFSTNPVTQPWRNRFDKSNRIGILGNVFAEAEILDGLSLYTSFGVDYANSRTLDLTQVTYEHAQNTNPPNSLMESRNTDNTWTWTNTANYNKSWGDHTFKALVGSEAINTFGNSLSATRLNLEIDDDEDFLVISAGTGAQTNSGSFSRSSLFSLFGRLDYTFKDRYFINGTLRRDQSSKFGRNYRTGYFPSAAVGWRISSESFMADATWLDDLKLRASWGVIGNQNGLDNNNQYDVYVTSDPNSYGISGDNGSRIVGLVPSRIGNPDTRWEKSATLNLGFDATLLRSTLDINFDWYVRRTTDLLAVNQAPFTGPSITQPSVNVGELTNKGIDLGITKRSRPGNFQYTASLIFSMYRNDVIRVLDNPLAVLAGGSTRIGNAVLTQAGYPISSFYGYQIDGFFNTQEEAEAYAAEYSTWLTPEVGRWRIKDINGDKRVDGNDRTILGSPHPDFQTSLNLSLAYKNFDFNCFFFWNQGGTVFNYTRYVIDFHTFTTNRSTRMLYESWTPELGDRAKLPKLDLNDSYSSSNITDYFLEDASYLRMKTVQLGYTLPKAWSSRIGMENFRIYVQGQNLLTISKSTLMDPGYAQASGGDTSMGVVNNYVPTPKQFIFGLSVNL
ncbi:SusC/RagA family TonB-linked outer membrane protein [Parapedobacter koreensis]|uniref:TonB-linked outer membrane protein, SusC/RagA family n=1 Tax=Parapedobacter koreensis TaxID=332977 RepID=A0A1H7S0B3_9SPHI|nr:TonB-dependent receptor [Parapedobacter koreensis]SEL66021.1 TonB-linked outer membrane protein, SusC/RagA family [Parapedobacter koreensis]